MKNPPIPPPEIQSLSADILSRLEALKQDHPVNAETVLNNLIMEAFLRLQERQAKKS